MDSKYDDDDDYESKQQEGKYQEQKELDSHGNEKSRRDRISDDDLLERVQRYFFEDDAFTKTFENFVKEESRIIDITSDEYKLEYTEVYERFKALFERTLERYITQQGCTILDFYNAMSAKQESDPDGSFAIFGQILVSVTDFHIFMTMMRESARAQSHK
mmetsp:Transcript_36721/g.68316  ORF Transcript_36721/g.68316 Transcript_36721/m.68316 type:complete len:160 (+) Transcript_36721:35-514(+)